MAKPLKLACLILASSLTACAKTPSIETGAPEQIMCTQDAMQCPDGSWVGRSGPGCAFVCPSGNTRLN